VGAPPARRVRPGGRAEDAAELVEFYARSILEQVEARPGEVGGQRQRFAERARRELRAAGASPRAAAERDPSELTPHELRVAQLVSQGMTNREAAAALFVSTKTVEHHLRLVFRKLGIRRRAELARLMAR
jgi:DNA-binding NarL/FixJ family response regulator